MCLLIEFVGCLFITFAYDMGLGVEGIASIMLAFMIMSWGRGTQHFNSGLTVAELFYHSDEFSEKLPFYACILMAQVGGSLMGIFFAFMVTYVDRTNDYA